MKILYHGPFWRGSTSVQRVDAFARQPGVEVEPSDTGHRLTDKWTLVQRIRWKIRFPADVSNENGSLIARAEAHRPDIVFVDNSRVISRATIARLRHGGAKLVYYTPDNVIAPYAWHYPLLRSFPEWDCFFTTKSFNVESLRRTGVRRPLLVGKAYDPNLHFPMTREEVGVEYEKFDLVFIGTFEAERCRAINRLARSNMSVVVYSGNHNRWRRAGLAPSVTLRPDLYADEYRRAWHHGKLALGFLRKISRDQITHMTMEIAAMGRPMLAERTAEHDAHFRHGIEYVGFVSEKDLVEQAKSWLQRDAERIALGAAARRRCETSRYSTMDRAAWMVQQMAQLP